MGWTLDSLFLGILLLKHTHSLSSAQAEPGYGEEVILSLAIASLLETAGNTAEPIGRGRRLLQRWRAGCVASTAWNASHGVLPSPRVNRPHFPVEGSDVQDP